MIRKRGSKFVLYTSRPDSKTGKRRALGTHASRSKAEAQERAVQARKHAK